MNMNSHDLVKRAETAAARCDAHGFHATASALRALAEEMLDVDCLEAKRGAYLQHLNDQRWGN